MPNELELVNMERPKRAPTTKALLKSMTEGESESRKQTNVWLSESEKALLTRAARRSGQKLGQFIREHALAEAKRILE